MRILKKLLIALLIILILLAIAGWWVVRGVPAKVPFDKVTGTDPTLYEPQPQTIPTVKVAKPVGWKSGEAPVAAQGLTVTRFAEGLVHPRNMLTLPNGDIIVAETNAPARIISGGGGIMGGITNFVAGLLFAQAGADVPSPNKLVLLQDKDGDGVAETKAVLRSDLASPAGLAWRDGKLYVANHNAVLQFDYALGATTIAGTGKKLMDLPGAGNHWSRNLLLNPDGTLLYVSVGSSSNIGDGGMDLEKGRAQIDELNLKTGQWVPFAAGLRNPNGLAWNPWTNELWTTVNERDQLGSDLVPDYLTNVPLGAQYGWPWLYWGKNIDDRVKAPMPNYLQEYSRKPVFAMGPHVAALGLTFTGAGNRMGAAFGQGAFVARHGSWNRKPASGYDVVFVNFDKLGNPTGKPVPVLTGFLNSDGTTKGRPSWVAWDKTGALLVSDDTGGIIWRVMAPGAPANAAPTKPKLDASPKSYKGLLPVQPGAQAISEE
ncbi:MAG: PQQ-dependent sugar dehydrogenase [Candidatus Andeanibacterium colombiense]|uniref:PQQ-dependent sugar dehydrogenase n=1 Tax=Candidatus Andeanibacterium colombiense TaxID=3121345 RepID=A0AAJ5X3P0_9SPHN|nr:MAG: PQQ-dependent sugar dehydrogenase [Sphingomonadaceae bacterium]